MIIDLKMDVKIVICPIVREKDGLAMSSRNSYLSVQERNDALVIYKSLMHAGYLIENGERKSKNIISEMENIISQVSSSQLDYADIVDAGSFIHSHILEAGKEYYILAACKIGSTRLIDNIKLKIPFS
jgi:pantoate--beta-alanine ligase